MKKISIFAASAILIAFSLVSCSKIKDTIAKNIPNITYDDDKAIITIPASSSTAQQTAFGGVTFDLNQYIKSQASGSGIDYSYVKHVYVRSVIATLVDGDANNNFNNLTFSTDSNPVVIFNTTPDINTATQLGGNLTTQPSDPYTLVIPITNNTDILSHLNGKDWAYGFSYKLKNATTKPLQLKLEVKYELSFQK